MISIPKILAIKFEVHRFIYVTIWIKDSGLAIERKKNLKISVSCINRVFIYLRFNH